jgi:hypothetical protein
LNRFAALKNLGGGGGGDVDTSGAWDSIRENSKAST